MGLEKFGYGYDNDGFYIGLVNRQPDPVELGRWLMPRNTTDIEPPLPVEGKRLKFLVGQRKWIYVDVDLHIVQKPVEIEVIPQKSPYEDLDIIGERFKNLDAENMGRLARYDEQLKGKLIEIENRYQSRVEALSVAVNGIRSMYEDVARQLESLRQLVEINQGSLSGVFQRIEDVQNQGSFGLGQVESQLATLTQRFESVSRIVPQEPGPQEGLDLANNESKKGFFSRFRA